MDLKKVVTSAVCIIPPQDIWPPVQQIRAVHDRGYIRWPPHVNLLYPFAENNELSKVIPKIQAAVQTIKPFHVTFDEFKHFKHGKNSFTMWLEPTPSDKVQALQLALVDALPFFDDQNTLSKPKLTKKQKNAKKGASKKSGSVELPTAEEMAEMMEELPSCLDDSAEIEPQTASSSATSTAESTIDSNETDSKNAAEMKWGLFTPHMSVGQWEKKAEMDTKKDEFSSNWKPIEMLVDRIHIITRIEDQPFEVRYTILLDGTVIPEKVITVPEAVPYERQLFVRSLPRSCTSEKLREVINQVITVKEPQQPPIEMINMQLIKRPDGTCKGYGFFGVESVDIVNKLVNLSDLGLFKMEDRTIVIAPANKKEQI